MGTLRDDLTRAVNAHSRENDSNTPDFLLAQHLLASLEVFEMTSLAREDWYGHRHEPGQNSLPDVPEEERRVVLAERKLEEARAEGIITNWSYDSPRLGGTHGQEKKHHRYPLGLQKAGHFAGPWGNTRLAAAEAAAAEVDRLRAAQKREAKKRPKPEEMTQHDREDELHRLGWEHAWGGPADEHHMRPLWMDVAGVVETEDIFPREGESWETTTCRALREARRARALAGEV